MEPDTRRNPWRQHRKWVIVVAAALIVLSLGTGFGGYQAVHAHRANEALERANATAVAAAKDCVAATQPPDAAALPAAQRKLIECSTGNFGAQAAWYGAVLTQAYQAVDVRVQVPEMHAAVESNNDDGSIVALLAFRAKVSQPGLADRENSYRVRVKMVPEGGQFKVAELDQVAK
ncbi:Mce protein [Mycolicibacterium fluoranthenivorans]|uniref:Mce protein n=1 Tax=Mycolicibacterium fluoranthenivorans TaxID=258505 RepID=UPI001F19936F|nr:Mce protein [Mycolicibacterium fluoranthenivorans]